MGCASTAQGILHAPPGRPVDRGWVRTAQGPRKRALWGVKSHKTGCVSAAPGNTICPLGKPEDRGWIGTAQGPEKGPCFCVLGCLLALLLIYGIAPEPLSPAVFQLAVNNFDLWSLIPECVRQWFLSLQDLLEAWKSMGPEGDLAPLVPFCHFS
ncbi:hypothetical protein DFH08DRAFT_823180 [Mycena albidolilacea]|uniref:Uncharacterized protein n=1 Tax=Mycena albidolilacea TaxID=1033008 RepID=A0AAD7ECE7_9AGAR|nr:hypothetical protein DFH08DRAFT_823180 [Mycena albidolilacea]